MSKKLLALMVSVLMLATAATAMAATKSATKTRKVGGTIYASISKLTGAKATITGFSQTELRKPQQRRRQLSDGAR